MTRFEREAAVYVLYASHNLQAAAFSVGTPWQSVLSSLGKHRVAMRELPSLCWPERFNTCLLGFSPCIWMDFVTCPSNIIPKWFSQRIHLKFLHLLKFTRKGVSNLNGHTDCRFTLFPQLGILLESLLGCCLAWQDGRYTSNGRHPPNWSVLVGHQIRCKINFNE